MDSGGNQPYRCFKAFFAVALPLALASSICASRSSMTDARISLPGPQNSRFAAFMSISFKSATQVSAVSRDQAVEREGTSVLVHTTAIFKLFAADSSHSNGTWREITEKSDDCSDRSVIAREMLATMKMWWHFRR